MRRLAVLVALAALAAPAPAAAQLNELPFEALPKRATATCLRATGVPGGLALLGPLTRRDSATDLLTAGGAGTALASRVVLGGLQDCAAVAEAPGGAAVMAAGVVDERGTRIRAGVRDPGGAFGEAVTLGRVGLGTPAVAVAVSPAGHAVVVWAQYRGRRSRRSGPDIRIVAVRRAPSGRFGPVESLTPWRSGGSIAEPRVAAGLDATGVATLAWLRPRPDTSRSRGIAQLEAAFAAPSTTFRVHRLPAQTQEFAVRPALAVAPDGRALLAITGIRGLAVFERAPGTDRFAAVRLDPRQRVDEFASAPVVALRAGGGALVAWRSGFDERRAGVEAATRAAAGPFGPVVRVARADTRDVDFGEILVFAVGGPSPPADPGNNRLAAALAPDGRALLAWTAGGVLFPRAAAGTLGAGFGPPQRLGSPVRDANGLAPLFLADGRAALAWTDNTPQAELFPRIRGHGRLHVAVEGAPAAPAAAPPRLTLRADRTQRLFRSQPLRLTATCDGACDLQATTRDARSGATRLTAGSTRLSLNVESRSRRVRVVVRAAAPGGRRTVSEAVRIRVVRRPPLPVPLPLDVRARRSRGSIVVSWRTATPARRTFFIVTGTRRRTERPDFLVPLPQAIEFARGRGRTQFSIRLRGDDLRKVRWVAVTAASFDSERQRTRVAPVRVR